MKTRLLSWLLLPALLGVGFSLGARADESSDASKALAAVLRREMTAKTPDSEGLDRSGEIRMAPMMISQLQTAISAGEPTQIDQMLDQIEASFPSASVAEAAEKLRIDVRAKAAERLKALDLEIQAALDAATKAVLAASKPADLDETLDDLRKAAAAPEDRFRSGLNTRSEKLRAARQFVVQWQDYLADRDAGSQRQAIQDLRSASGTNSETLLPRSTILARIKDLSDLEAGYSADRAREIMAKVKTLDDLPDAIRAVNRIRLDPGGSRSDWQDVVGALSGLLNSIESTYLAYKAGVPADMTISMHRFNGYDVNGEAVSLVEPLRVGLMRLVAPRFLGIDEKPRPEETIEEYLNRVTADASARLDARLLGKTFELMNRLGEKSDPVPPALEMLTTAQNQDEAEQFELAVVSYETALKTGGDLVPPKEIGARLAAIKAAHPAEFQLGLQRFMGLPEPSPMPGRGAASAQPSATIKIPGARPPAGKP